MGSHQGDEIRRMRYGKKKYDRQPAYGRRPSDYGKMSGNELGKELLRWISDIENERVADTEQNCLSFKTLCETIAARLASDSKDICEKRLGGKNWKNRHKKNRKPNENTASADGVGIG